MSLLEDYMCTKSVPYVDMVQDIACVLQEFNAVGKIYGIFVYDMANLSAEGGGGRVDISLIFNPERLHGCIAPEDEHV
jgi:hypothetical protein